ncbi:MAG: tRNA preQ1(34) S-adenosylmethionine ribosyltransferase-isomerase QueA [Caldilineales bacterium]|nr:tRNA preQ1(34) S-adenosylmethionine ribosyltransferase-isomerase QueA [Caldilineales bacterium]
MNVSEFDYYLPPELIAQTPIEPRDASRLLVVHRQDGRLEHRIFRDIVEYLRPGDLLVANDSRVIPARLRGRKRTGGQVEILLLRPAATPAPSAGETWECLVGGKGLRPGVQVVLERPGRTPAEGEPEAPVVATVEAALPEGRRLVRFNRPTAEWLYALGETPLPPYIHQPLADSERYQTVYSRVEGSVASSTAGLHFTPELLLTLRERGVGLAFVTLHIGLGTFQPVKVERVENHVMHSEWASLSPEVARQINDTTLRGGRIVAVGTTVVRTLEWAATGAQGIDPYGEGLCPWQRVAAFEGETDLFIRPGYRFRAVDALITNFHLPRSTLLMLVSAFAGKALIERAYAEAVAQRYRFYSFGDAMLIL